MSVNLLLGSDGDILLARGNLVLGDSVAQRLTTRLRMLRNEWFLNMDDGTPYLQQGDQIGASILGPNVSIDFVRSAFTDRILGTEGVTGIILLELSMDRVRRKLSVHAVVSSREGAIEVNL